MTDRLDPSQYPTAQDFRDRPAIDYPDGTAPAEPQGEVVYATDEDMVNYLDPSQLPTPENHRPALTVTLAPPTRELRYRNVSGGGTIALGANLYGGISVRNTDPANPAVIRLRDGIDAGGPVVIPVALAAGASLHSILPLDSVVKFGNGVYVEIVTGTIEGTIFTVKEYQK